MLPMGVHGISMAAFGDDILQDFLWDCSRVSPGAYPDRLTDGLLIPLWISASAVGFPYLQETMKWYNIACL
jgi:hypothetical protein